MFSDIWQCLYYAIIRTAFIEKLNSTVGYFLATFCWCWFINCTSWMSYYFSYLNYATYFRDARRLSIVYVWRLLVFSFMESSILTIFYILSLFLVFKLRTSCLQILHLISDYVTFLGSADIGAYLVVAYFERWILTIAHFSDAFFWPIVFTCQVCISYHILEVLLKVFSIGIYKKSNHYLLLLAIFHNLELTQLWSVNYFSLVYKSKLLLWTCPKFWEMFLTDL